MGSEITKSPKILLVDDETAILHALGMYLEHEGYSVEAIAKYGNYLNDTEPEKWPDIIILDILLNQEDGSKIAKELKKDSKTKKIPIIMISALPGGKKLAEEARADAYLAKPFEVDELNQLIERLTKKTAGQKS